MLHATATHRYQCYDCYTSALRLLPMLNLLPMLQLHPSRLLPVLGLLPLLQVLPVFNTAATYTCYGL